MMPFDLSRTLRQAEDWLRRGIKSKAVREAEKRRRERRAREAARRAGQAVAAGGATGAAALGVATMAGSAVGLAVAGAAAAFGTAAFLLWPERPRSELDELELVEVIAAAEDWLLTRRRELPGRAIAAVDPILARLADLRPQLAPLDQQGPLAGEARRLIGRHLPALVDAYFALPALAREEDGDIRAGLVDGLATIAEEMERLCIEASRERRLLFETQGRFLESRYRDGDF